MYFIDGEPLGKWRDLGPGIYEIHNLKDRGQSNYSPVLRLENEVREKIWVWATVSLAYKILFREQTRYIYYLGIKRTEEGRIYYDFKLL